jgi:hypothetical protein
MWKDMILYFEDSEILLKDSVIDAFVGRQYQRRQR